MKDAIWRYEDLKRLLKRDFPLVRRWAFEKLVELYGRSRVRRIADLIDDPDDYVSSGAIRFLSARHHRKWAFRILRKFEESGGDVAASCAIALGELRYTEAIQVFRSRVSEGVDYEALMGVVSALRLMPCRESTEVLLSIGEAYSEASNGAFLAEICDALLSTRDRDGISFVAGLYMERSFSLDDGGSGVLRALISHTDSGEFIDEFRSFVEKPPYDILRHIKENVRNRLGEILGEDFVRKTAEKFLKTNYVQLLRDIRETGEMALYSRGVIRNEEELESDDLSGQGLFNYRLIERFAEEPRLLHVMSLSEIKKAIILCICSLLRMVYGKRAAARPGPGVTADMELLVSELGSVPDGDMMISRLVEVADSRRKVKRLREMVLARLAQAGDVRSKTRCLRLLGSLEPAKDLDTFWRHLGMGYDDGVCQEAEKGMVRAGGDAVRYISAEFKSGDESQKMFSFGIVSRIPIPGSVRLILENMDEMWEGYRDFVLYAVNELGSRKFAGPILDRLEAEGLPDIEETYLLLCDLNGIEDARLSGARERVLAELKRTDSVDEIECDRTKAIRRNHCNRKLICRHCSLSRARAE
jgi:hypothetical protein